VRLVADGLAAAVVLTGVTVGAANLAGGSVTASHAKTKTIKVSTTTIPHVGTVLTSASGLTLYRFTQDPAGMSVCTGACAKIWPPLTAAKGEHVQGPKGVKGLSLINVGHGRWQVAFHKVALYRYAGDTKKGQAHGQNVAHEWFAALKSGVPASGAAAATTTTAPTSTSTSQTSSGATPAPSGSTSSGQTAPATTPPTPAPAPAPTSTPATSPPPPPTTTPTTQPTMTTTTMAGGYGY
jgi:predicted lipoprotein with Yx(FWY)xxD motif